jgi:predicted DNA-binding protein with PD1-like motif
MFAVETPFLLNRPLVDTPFPETTSLGGKITEESSSTRFIHLHCCSTRILWSGWIYGQNYDVCLHITETTKN